MGPHTLQSVELVLLGKSVLVQTDDARFLRGFLRWCNAEPVNFADTRKRDLQLRVEACIARGERPRLRVTSEPAQQLPFSLLPHDQAPNRIACGIRNWVVTASADHYVFHAGVVGRDGRAIVLPGATGSGKSTLVAALVRSGFELLSDELAAVDVRTGKLESLPFAVSLRPDVAQQQGSPTDEGDSASAESFPFFADELGGRAANERMHVGWIAAPSFDRAATATRVSMLPPGEAFLTLLEHSCSQPRFRSAGVELCMGMATRAPAFRFRYSDVQEVVRAIEQLFDTPVLGADSDRALHFASARTGTQFERTDSDAASAAAPPVHRPRRRADLLQRALASEVVVYDPCSDHAFLLNSTAAKVLDLCDGARSSKEISAVIAQECAAPPAEVESDVLEVLYRFRRDRLVTWSFAPT